MRPITKHNEVKRPTMDCVPSVVVITHAIEDETEKMETEVDPLDAEPAQSVRQSSPSIKQCKEDRWSPSFREKSPNISPPQRQPSGPCHLMLKKSRMAPVKPLRMPSPRKTPRRKVSEKVKAGDLRKTFLRLK